MRFTRREFLGTTALALTEGREARVEGSQDAPPLRLGMLGMWHAHADGIVKRVAENPKEFMLVGFHDPDPETVTAKRKLWEPLLGVRVFEKPEQLLEEKLDGVVVDGRVDRNLRMARLALESGRPVLLEKPAGDNLEEYRNLVRLAREKRLHLQMIYLFRYMSAVQEMLARAKKGELGRIYEFRARLPKDLTTYARNVWECSRFKGGIFFEMAGHVIDLMVAVLGKPRSIAPALAHHHAGDPADFIDNGVAVFGFDRAWGIIEVPALEVVPHQRRLEVYGTGGACVIPHLGTGPLAEKPIQPIDLCPAGQAEWKRLELPAATLQIADLREFRAVSSGRKAPDFDLDHDLVVQETLLRACGMA